MLGILCGLEAEAKIARRIPGAQVACAAAMPLKARQLARELIAEGATRLMSFGVAGALDPAMPVGTLAVGSHIASHRGDWPCEPVWMEQLMRALPTAQRAAVWGSETLVPTATEKAALFASSGCSVVDMESQCAAEIANEAGLPLAVVRAVCDEATHNVPMLVMDAINSDGSTNYAKAITGVLKSPMQAFDLIKVGRSMNAALRVLEDAAAALSR